MDGNGRMGSLLIVMAVMDHSLTSQLSISKKNSSVPGIKEAGGGIETKKATEIPNINHLPIFSTSISSRMPDA